MNVFAVIPDDHSDSASDGDPGSSQGLDAQLPAAAQPVALFEHLEDALDWGATHFQGRAFRVRYQRMLALRSQVAAH